MSNDRRAFLRYHVRNDGRLLFVDEPCIVECTIRDISEDGALLSMPAPALLPPVVLLWEERTGALHECEVMWRKGRALGVHFRDLCGRATRREVLEKGFAQLKRVSASSPH